MTNSNPNDISRSVLTLVFRLTIVLVLISMSFLSGCNNENGTPESGSTQSASGKKDDQLVIAVLPKLINIAYFDACQKGAQEAADELGVKLIYDGPTSPSGTEQIKFMETWIRQGVDAICVAPNQPKTIRSVVEKAQKRGIKVITWDTDAAESGRDLMVNQVDYQTLGEKLIDEIAEQMNEEGEWAVAIATLDATNLNTWRKFAEERAKSKYPKMKKVETLITEEDENVARQKVETLLNAHPEVKGIIAFDANSVPGSAEAIKRSGKAGKVALTGNTTPDKIRPYLKEDVLQSAFLWDPVGLGDVTVRLAVALCKGEKLEPGTKIEGYGELKFNKDDPKMVIFADPIRFTKKNIDNYEWGF